MRLHVGCGGVHLDGYVNIDRRWMPGVDLVANIGILPQVEPESIQRIYACHVLDHFDRWTYKTVLRRWYDILEYGGELLISLPDFEWTAQRYAETGDLGALTGQLYAAQDYDDNIRHFAWDFRQATRDLTSVGFKNVERFASFADDASRLIDDKGRPRSLNVVAYK